MNFFRTLGSRFSLFGFVLLFPMFFFYHFLVGVGVVPPFLGGYFGVMALLLMVVYFIRPSGFFSRKFSAWVFIGILVWVVWVALMNYAADLPRGYSLEMLAWSFQGVLFNLVCYFIGKNIEFSAADAKLILIFFVLMFFVVVFNVGDSGIFYIKQTAGDVAGSVATYQGFARSLVFVLLMLVSLLLDKKNLMLAIFLCGSVALFLNGARTEFVLFVISVVSLLIVKSGSSVKSMLYFLLVFFLVLIGGYFLLSLAPESRMMQLLNLSSSSSYLARVALNEFALITIANSPVWGGYGEYTSIGGVGSYPHSLLSAWANLGVLGFLGYVFLFAFLWIQAGFAIMRNLYTNESFYSFFVFLVFSTLAVIFSKPYSYMMVGFVVGLNVRFANKYKIMIRE